ncbi:MAG: hypothetical protein ACM3X6_07845 [Patescibacteria group bacterium]
MIKKMVLIFIMSFILSTVIVSNEPTLLASDINWESQFGSIKDKPSIIYCLMGMGFFRAPTSKEIDEVIHEWLAEHPEAYLVPISIMQPLLNNDPDSKLIYVWVVDGDDNLNIHLVRMGCCSASAMQSLAAIDFSDLENDQNTPKDDWFIEVISQLKQQKLLIDKEEYEKFITKTIEAEQQAMIEKLGIWGETP